MKLLETVIIGLTNCGKSTLINQIMKNNSICMVSCKPHTTRKLTLASLEYKNTHIILFDTPGLNSSNKQSIQNINNIAKNSVLSKDLCIVMFDGLKPIPAFLQDFALSMTISKIAIINKIDAMNRGKLLPFIDTLKNTFDHIIPISALENQGIDKLLEIMSTYATRETEQEVFTTNVSYEERLINRTQEAILENLDKEIPYQCEVINDSIEIKNGSELIIRQSIIAKSSHYKIFLSKIKEISMMARIKMVDMFKNNKIEWLLSQRIPYPINKIHLFIIIKYNKN